MGEVEQAGGIIRSHINMTVGRKHQQPHGVSIAVVSIKHCRLPLPEKRIVIQLADVKLS